MIGKITELVFKSPEKWMHIREMARLLKVSPNSVRNNITKLRKTGIVQEQKDGIMVKYRANLEGISYKREKMLHNLRSVYSSGIVDSLYQFYSPKAIVLFGSYSRGDDTSTSDIDIGVQTSDKRVPDLRLFEKKLSRKIQLSLFTKKEVSKEFFNNIINGIVLKGFIKNE